MQKEIQMAVIIDLLIKQIMKVDFTGRTINKETLNELLSINDLEKLHQLNNYYQSLDNESKAALLLQLTSSVFDVVNHELDNQNISAMIVLKVFLIKMTTYTVSITIVLVIAIGTWKGTLLDLTILKEIWGLVETMFLK